MKNYRRRNHRGSAVVELAICLPVVMLLVWGTIELNNSIFIKQTLTSAAHEGALVGQRNSTETEILARVESVLQDRLEVPYACRVECSTGSYDAALPGDIFTVVVTANPKSFSDAIEVGEVDARVSAIKQQ